MNYLFEISERLLVVKVGELVCLLVGVVVFVMLVRVAVLVDYGFWIGVIVRVVGVIVRVLGSFVGS